MKKFIKSSKYVYNNALAEEIVQNLGECYTRLNYVYNYLSSSKTLPLEFVQMVENESGQNLDEFCNDLQTFIIQIGDIYRTAAKHG